MLRVLIVDDEDLARLRLRTVLMDCRDAAGQPLAHAVGEAATVAQATAWLAQQAADVVLLDVNLPGAAGTELARTLGTDGNGAAVIFVTAHPEHALQAFELDAVDYLTKPVRRERLEAALRRAGDRRATREAAHARAEAIPAWPTLLVHERGRIERVSMADVLYLRADQKYVMLHTSRREYVLDDSLADLEQRHAAHLLRIHRSILVARHTVRALERREEPSDAGGGESWGVVLAPADLWLPVSRRQLAGVREALASLQ